MRSHFRLKKLLSACSLLALSVGPALAPERASAQTGVYGGGSSSASLFVRQLFDCYAGSAFPGDGYSITTGTFVSVPPSPDFLPSCIQVPASTVVGLFAGVGSGRGQQAYLSDDPLQLVNGGTELVNDGQTLPGTPEYLDGAASVTSLGVYPYPQLDFAASDAPLAGSYAALTTTTFAYAVMTDWATVSANGVITPDQSFSVGATGTATYNSASFGPAIQVPLFAMPLAIAVDTVGLTVNSANTTTTVAGGAIQLNIPQLCAIFSGTVTDWSSKASIADKSTTGSELFYAANTGKNTSFSSQYSTTISPIHVVYRKDDSGASYIMTNFLKATCPQLDNGANQYSAIFSASNLPSTNFAELIYNIIVYGPTGPGAVANWTGATGSSGVASLVGNSVAGLIGAVGYVSADWTRPYSNALTAPSSASVQSAVQFNAKHNTPFSAAGFVAPTPTAANTALAAVSLSSLNAASSYNDWNIYNVTTIVAGASVSLLGFNATANAYPLAGTTFLDVYGCYRTAARAANITNFLNWYFNNNATTTASTISNPTVAQILTNNGFGQLPISWMNAIYNEYLSSGSPNAISSADKSPRTGACANVTGSGA